MWHWLASEWHLLGALSQRPDWQLLQGAVPGPRWPSQICSLRRPQSCQTHPPQCLIPRALLILQRCVHMKTMSNGEHLEKALERWWASIWPAMVADLQTTWAMLPDSPWQTALLGHPKAWWKGRHLSGGFVSVFVFLECEEWRILLNHSHTLTMKGQLSVSVGRYSLHCDNQSDAQLAVWSQ